MTPNTSAVAVCCSNASRVSVKSRAFSIAMTAWAAKVLQWRDMGKRDAFHYAPERVSRLRKNSGPWEFPEWRGGPLVRHSIEPLSVIDHQGAEGRLAKRMCLLKQRLKHWREVAR